MHNILSRSSSSRSGHKRNGDRMRRADRMVKEKRRRSGEKEGGEEEEERKREKENRLGDEQGSGSDSIQIIISINGSSI